MKICPPFGPADGPAIADDVVHHDEQHVLSFAETPAYGTKQSLVGEIKRLLNLFVDHSRGNFFALRNVPQIVDL